MATMVELPPAQVAGAVTNPRKRKKRAPAAGAANDCFKCTDRHLKCDRRRPYCSQCLDAGQDCSGYKTQLTWGVGVASRGKLRGLSLPVAGTPKVADNDSPPKAKKRRDTQSGTPQILLSSAPLPRHAAEHFDAQPQATVVAATSPTSTISAHTPSTAPAIWDPTLFSAPHSLHTQHFLKPQHSSGLGQSYDAGRGFIQSPTYHQQPRLNLQASPWANEASASDLFRASEVESHSQTTLSVPSSASHFQQPSPILQRPAQMSPMGLGFDPATSKYAADQNERTVDGISMLLEAGQSVQAPDNRIMESADDEVFRDHNDECAVSEELALYSATSPLEYGYPIPMLPGLNPIGKTSRMQYLINYYAEVISPVIVAFDSQSNPWRTQILRLAENSETLQHAISALAASNLRQRRGTGLLSTGKTAPARRSSFAHMHLTNDFSQALLSPEDQIREETLHKRLAVSQLNQQLAHPVLRKDDSILATLLILCMFHACDSGIAKFQTQFAGVRKLLALRGEDTKIGGEESRWMTRMFTWFDTLAAMVNDREEQINGHFLDISALYGDWALENMAGIDASLFRIISRLGRLNLLKQGRMVTKSEHSPTVAPPPPSFEMTAYATLDGNGWMSNEQRVGLGIDEIHDDTNYQFWQDWKIIRHDLLSWSLDTTLFDTLSQEASSLTVEQRADLKNISESFRYSALVYTERLAQPHLPPNDEAIQRWVRQSLVYIEQVVSDVYLLWALFITGTECINEDQRRVIRARCQDIQKDSGFVNNASCLQLLEKVWDAQADGSSPSTERISISTPSDQSDASTGSAFMFREIMMKEAALTEGEGEYIVA